MIENRFLENEVIVPLAHSEHEALKVFMYYYSGLGYFQVVTSQNDHYFFNSKLYDVYFDKIKTVKTANGKTKKKERHHFYSIENMVRLKKYGSMYLDFQIKQNKKDLKKPDEAKQEFENFMKRCKRRLIKAFDDKIEYLKDFELLCRLEGVKRRKQISEEEVEARLARYKYEKSDEYAKQKALIDVEFTEQIAEEQFKVKKTLLEKSNKEIDLNYQPKKSKFNLNYKYLANKKSTKTVDFFCEYNNCIYEHNEINRFIKFMFCP